MIISIFLGTLGVDRFMLGDIGMGILKLLTVGLCGVLTIIDWCTIQKRVREQNWSNLMHGAVRPEWPAFNGKAAVRIDLYSLRS